MNEVAFLTNQLCVLENLNIIPYAFCERIGNTVFLNKNYDTLKCVDNVDNQTQNIYNLLFGEKSQSLKNWLNDIEIINFNQFLLLTEYLRQMSNDIYRTTEQSESLEILSTLLDRLIGANYEIKTNLSIDPFTSYNRSIIILPNIVQFYCSQMRENFIENSPIRGISIFTRKNVIIAIINTSLTDIVGLYIFCYDYESNPDFRECWLRYRHEILPFHTMPKNNEFLVFGITPGIISNINDTIYVITIYTNSKFLDPTASVVDGHLFEFNNNSCEQTRTNTTILKSVNVSFRQNPNNMTDLAAFIRIPKIFHNFLTGEKNYFCNAIYNIYNTKLVLFRTTIRDYEFACNIKYSMYSMSDVYAKILYMTQINVVLSTLGLFGVISTYMMYEGYRRENYSMLALNSSIALLMQYTFFEIVAHYNYFNFKSSTCLIFNSCLRFSSMVVFNLSLFSAYNFYRKFIALDQVTIVDNLKMKIFIIGWLIPLIIIIPSVLFVDVHVLDYFCYSSIFPLYMEFFLPSLCVLIINAIMYFVIFVNIYYRRIKIAKRVTRPSTGSFVYLKMFVFTFGY